MPEHRDPVAEHREQNARRHEEQLRQIRDERLRQELRNRLDFYYRCWTQGIKKAAAERYNDSPRIYERKLAERRIDQRLIPAEQKEQYRQDAIREAIAISRMRIDDINRMVPRIIDKALDDAVKLHRLPEIDSRLEAAGRTQSLDEALRRAAKQKQQERDRDLDKGRDRE